MTQAVEAVQAASICTARRAHCLDARYRSIAPVLFARSVSPDVSGPSA